MGLQGKFLVVVLVVLLSGCGCVRGDREKNCPSVTDGQCLVSCGNDIVGCCTECLSKGPESVPCILNCGMTNVGCMGGCLGTKLPSPSDAESPAPSVHL